MNILSFFDYLFYRFNYNYHGIFSSIGSNYGFIKKDKDTYDYFFSDWKENFFSINDDHYGYLDEEQKKLWFTSDYGIFLLSAFQFINVITLTSFAIFVFNREVGFSFFFYICLFALAIIILIFNFFRYKRIVTYFQLFRKHMNQNRKRKKSKTKPYCLISIILFVISMIIRV